MFRVGFVNVARVEGVIRRDDGGAASGARIELVARVPQVNLEGSTRTSTADANGRFGFQNVPPGDYRLMARSAPAPRLPDGTSPPGPLQWAETGLVVSGQDVQNLGLTLEPAPVMTGRVGFTGTTFAPPSDLTTIRLQFVETDAIASQLAGGSGTRATFTAVVDAGGSFRVEGLPPGRYGVSASWPGIRRADGEGWWLTDISIGGRSIGDAPIDVRLSENVADVTIGFRDRIGMIEGRLTDPAGQPAAEYFVLAFPAERSLWTTTSRRAVPAVRPGTDGRFRLAGLLAGDYYVAVVTAIEPDEVMDPAYLSAILPGAIRLAVKDGETVRQDLKIGR